MLLATPGPKCLNTSMPYSKAKIAQYWPQVRMLFVLYLTIDLSVYNAQFSGPPHTASQGNRLSTQTCAVFKLHLRMLESR